MLHNISSVTVEEQRRYSSVLFRKLSSLFAELYQDRHLSIPRHKSNGFIARRKLSPVAAASCEAEDHVEDPRVRNANCNYGRACAHDILRSRSLSSLHSVRSLFLTLAVSLSFFLSFFLSFLFFFLTLLLSGCISTRKLQRHV